MDQYFNPNAQFYGNPGNGFMYNPQMYNGYTRMPTQQNALTNEEIQKIQTKKPTSVLNLEVDEIDVLRAICTHKENGIDRVTMLNDGSGKMYCPICGAVWDPKNWTKEEIAAIAGELVEAMQSAKWIGDYPIEVVRNYFAIIPMIMKFPDIFDYASKNFEKFYTQRGFMNAPDANIHAQYNGLFSANNMMGGVPQYGMPMGYYNQAPNMQMASPVVNPMQQPMNPNFNPQFANQANVMMGGTYYPQAPAWAPQQNGQVMVPPQTPMNPYAVNPQQPPVAPQPGTPATPGYSPVYGANPQAAAPTTPQPQTPPAANNGNNPQTVVVEPKTDL